MNRLHPLANPFCRLLALVPLPLLLSCGMADDGLPDQLLVVVIDTVRSDSMGFAGGACDATPELDALALRGTAFTRVAPPRGMTFSAVATLLTAAHPRTHGVWEADDPLSEDVATWIQGASRPTAVFAVNACNVYRAVPDLDVSCYSEPAWDQDNGLLYDPEAVEDLKAWVADHHGSWAAVLHLLAPHAPYLPVDEHLDRVMAACPGAVETDLDADRLRAAADGTAPLTDEERAWAHRLQESAVAFDDALVGELVRWLEAHGFFDDGLLLVGADHGEELYDHAVYAAHGEAIWPTVTNVAWLAVGPSFVPEGRVVADRICLEDLGATAFEVVGAQVPDHHGVGLWSVLTGEEAPPARTCFAQVTDDVAVVTEGDLLWAANPSGRTFRYQLKGVELELTPPTEVLYDLSSDPMGTEDLLAERPDDARRLRDALCEFVAAGPYEDDRGEGSAIADACANGWD